MMDTEEEEQQEMVLPYVDAELLSQVCDMGFGETRARKALMSGAKNAEAALEWCLNHESDADIDVAIPLVDKKSATGKDQPALEAKSIKCVETGRLFRSVEEAQAYATKTGRTNFEECTEEKKALTEEEKKEKVKQLKELAARRRAEREGAEKVDDVVAEKKRREQGKEANVTKEQLEKAQRLREMERVKREKYDEKRERERLRAEIAKDKAERRARGGKLAGKLSADGYKPSIDQNDARRNEGIPVVTEDVEKGPVVSSGGLKPTLPAPERVDKAIASVAKYKAAGDGGVALKTLTAYVKNALEKGQEDPKFLRIPIDSKAFKERVQPLIGGATLLKTIGFAKTDDGTAFALDLDTRNKNLDLITNTLAKLRAARADYQAHKI